MTTVEAFVAANRFGLGPRPGELSTISQDPGGWLLQQLGSTDGAVPHLAGLPRSDDILAEFLRLRRDREARMRFNKKRRNPLYKREAIQRTLAAIQTDTPFRERLVQFWTNHFTISTSVGQIRFLAGAFEREAIRPYVTGRFADMLLAVVRHPAMLIYLDNVSSIGPNSARGLRSGRGLNENLAREILELHTLGVDGGYRQTDVIAFAKILTGWSISTPDYFNPGRFAFRDDWHEPESKQLLGRSYDQGGVAEGEAALQALAAHPSTARFIATKLARHFIADDPPGAVVSRLERAYLDSGGDLGVLARTLVSMPETGRDPLAKVKTPNDLVVSAFRLLGAPKKPKTVLAPLRLLGQMPYTAPSPAGWPDVATGWIGPESLLRRIELMELLAKRHANRVDPSRLADDAFGPVAMEETVTAVRRAASRREALALVFASREFQRR